MADLRHQITINAPLERVYAAIATQAGLRAWWTTGAVAEERVGGRAEFAFHKRRTVFHMTIDELEPRRRIVWSCQGDLPEWIGTTLTWDLVPGEHGIIVRFNHSGWKAMDEMYSICNTSWGALMHRLKAYAESGNAAPLWTE